MSKPRDLRKSVTPEQNAEPASKATKSTRIGLKHFTKSKDNKALVSNSQNKPFFAIKIPKSPAKPGSSRNNKQWVAKSSNSNLIAYCEVVVQEFLRLLAPELDQPKARVREDSNDKLGVATEYKSKMEPLWCDNKPTSKDKNKIPPEFGLTTFLAYFFNETDLKSDHFGKDGIRIDSDWALSALSNKSFATSSKISAENLESLPYPINYEATQWFDFIVDGKKNKLNERLAFHGISQSTEYRDGVNKGIARILLLSNDLISKFVSAYVPDETAFKLIRDFIISQKNQLLIEVKKLPRFQQYLFDSKNQKDMDIFINHVIEFKTTNNRPIFDNTNTHEIWGKFTEQENLIKKEIRSATPTTPKSDLNRNSHSRSF